MRVWLAGLSGGIFGAGLWLSGMTDTRKVQGWLDVFGAWDPTLAFVLGGAVVPMAVAWRVAPMPPLLPGGGVDGRLIAGSALFGVGWGLAGLCPGPAMASLSFGGLGGVVFLAAMALGMALNGWLGPRLRVGNRPA